MAKKKDVAVKSSGSQALVSMADLEKMYQSEAKAAVAAAPAPEGVPRISTKSEMFTIGETQLPDPLEVIVVADAHLNVWYPEAYDPDSPAPPGCFALAPALELNEEGKGKEGTGESAMHAHPTSPLMQGGIHDHDCATCEMNQFGSAEVGRGKACGNQRQLAVVMATDPALKGDSKEMPAWAILGLSPTALSPWGKFVAGLAKIEGRPPHGVIVTFTFDKRNKDERRRKAVVASGYKLITDIGMAMKIQALRKDILESKALLRPLPIVDKEDKKKAAKPAAKGKVVAKKGKKAA
jgi:hypothetical protein